MSYSSIAGWYVIHIQLDNILWTQLTGHLNSLTEGIVCVDLYWPVNFIWNFVNFILKKKLIIILLIPIVMIISANHKWWRLGKAVTTDT